VPCSLWSYKQVTQECRCLSRIYPLRPSVAPLLPQAGSVHRVVHKKQLLHIETNIGLPVMPVSSQVWIACCGDCKDPQLVSCSSEWVLRFVWYGVKTTTILGWKKPDQQCLNMSQVAWEYHSSWFNWPNNELGLKKKQPCLKQSSAQIDNTWPGPCTTSDTAKYFGVAAYKKDDTGLQPSQYTRLGTYHLGVVIDACVFEWKCFGSGVLLC